MIDGLFIIFIAIAFVTDVRHSKLPNTLTVCGTIVGIVFHVGTQGWNGLLFSIIGACTGFLIVLVLYLLGALGAGDVKLFAAIGAMMGCMFVLQTLIYSILCAGIIGLVLLLIKKQMRATGHKLTAWLISIIALNRLETLREIKYQKNIKFPFMYAVLPGVIVSYYYALL